MAPLSALEWLLTVIGLATHPHSWSLRPRAGERAPALRDPNSRLPVVLLYDPFSHGPPHMETASAFQVAPADDAERPGAYVEFPYDRDLVRRFRDRFPRARWRGGEERWFVPGTTSARRLDAWM